MLARADEAALSAILGDGGVITHAPDLLGYETPARYRTGRAAAVLRPRTTEAVSQAIAYCVRRNLHITPQGANTGLVEGSTPDASGEQLILNLERLTGRLEIDPIDRTIEASAGYRLSALNEALAPHGLALAIDLGADPTLGGMAASNTGGARFLRYGDMRRHVLAVEAVLFDEQGSIVRFGRGLRKDNSALALRQLMVGSFGALGVITSLVLEVDRIPEQRVAALLVPGAGRELDLLRRIEAAAGSRLSALEGMSGTVMRRALAHAPRLRDPFRPGEVPPFAMLAEIEDGPRAAGSLSLDEVLQRLLAEIVEDPNSPLENAFFGPAEEAWALRHALSEGLRASGVVVGFDLAFRRSKVFAFRAEAIARLAIAFPELEVCDFGHVADGGLHFNLVGSAADGASPKRLEALQDLVLSLAVEGFGASFSGEHGLGRANQQAYERFTPPAVQAKAASIVRLFAPASAGAMRFSP